MNEKKLTSTTSKGFWMKKLQDMFLVSLTLVPSLLFGFMALPMVQSLYYLTASFDESSSIILGGRYPITCVRDLTTGYDNSKPGNKAVLPVSKSSQMITFTFKNGLVTTLRTSGTEPKIKYYNELCASPDQKDLKELKNILSEMVSAVVEEFLQPKLNNLIARSS